MTNMFINPPKNGGWRALEKRLPPGIDIALPLHMHAMIFEPKLAHLAAQSLARTLAGHLECNGMTPARFDMIKAIGSRYRTIRQDKLCRILGVTSSNVARMIKALVHLDFVARRRNPDDRRTWDVWLTEKAETLLEREGADIMRWAHKIMIKLFFTKQTWLGAMIELEQLFDRYSQSLRGRRIALLYSYGHPDD